MRRHRGILEALLRKFNRLFDSDNVWGPNCCGVFQDWNNIGGNDVVCSIVEEMSENTFFAFLTTFVVCSLHFKLSAIVIPRSLWDVTTGNAPRPPPPPQKLENGTFRSVQWNEPDGGPVVNVVQIVSKLTPVG